MTPTANSPRFSDTLRDHAEPFWRQSVTHRFTRELIGGTLPDGVFVRYLIQDYAFIDTLARVLEHAMGHAPDVASKARLSKFLEAVTGDETDYFLRAFDALGVSKTQWSATEKTAATRRLSDVMLNAARKSYGETLAVLLPVEWVYLSWASAAGEARPNRFYLAEWIDIHANMEFANFVAWLRGETDRIGQSLPPEERTHLAALFRETVQLEAAFFDAAYD